MVDFSSLHASLPAGGISFRPARGEATTLVAFACDDHALTSALRRAVLMRPDFEEVDAGAASVLISDHAVAGASAPVLIIGSDQRPGPGESVLQSLEPRLILAAATLVAAGHRVEPAARPERRSAIAPLSRREEQVAALLVDGASNKVIARDLDISVHTAKFHVAAVLSKLGARNRADAVAIALRERLVES